MDDTQQTIGTQIDNPVVNITIPGESPISNQQETIQAQVEAGQSQISTEEKKDVDNANTILVEKTEAKPKHPGGRPCSFCPQYVRMMNKINLYIEYCRGNVDSKVHMPFLEELCGYDYLDMETDTLTDWRANVKEMPHDPGHVSAYHQELSRTIKKLLSRQKLLLLRRTLSPEGQVAGAIFQLKANHGLIEAEKQIHVGEKDAEPIQITIVEEDRHVAED